MNLIESLSTQLNMPQGKAKGLAGGVMDLIQNAVKGEVSEETATAFGSSMPEVQQWKAEGEAPDGDEGGGLGDLLGAGLSMLGSSSGSAGLVAGVASLIQKFGLEPSHAAIVAPLVTKFIESKLDPELLAKVQPILGMLGGAQGAKDSGIGGMLGGLLG